MAKKATKEESNKKSSVIPDTYNIEEIASTGDIEKLEEIYEQCEIEAFKEMLYCIDICKETLEWIISKGMDINKYHDEVLKQHIYKDGNIKLFIEHGMKPEILAEEVLLFAAGAHRPKAVKAAIELGHDMYTKRYSIGSYATALYITLLYGDFFDFPKMEQIARLFLENGYEVSEKDKEAFIRQAEDYEFRYDALIKDYDEAEKDKEKDFDYLKCRSDRYKEKQEEIERAYYSLYELLDIPPLPRYQKHDGVSEIIIPEGTIEEQFEMLYNTMVPSCGRAKSMQGETIRIIGTVNVGMQGGRENLNVDEKRMFKHLIEFLGQGNPLSDEEIKRVKEIRSSRLNWDKLMEIIELTIRWISMNTTPFPLPEVTYKK